jgi:hypothetical protein
MIHLKLGVRKDPVIVLALSATRAKKNTAEGNLVAALVVYYRLVHSPA